jgi:pullulanase/glycogen debranching enzyme
MKTVLSILAFFLLLDAFGQDYTEEEKLQGYTVETLNVIFIFDPAIYNVNPERVVVTGAFRGWDAGMDKTEWQLINSGKLWTLNVPNPDFETIQPNTKFKFRINEGEWIEPPAEAFNKNGGDMVFMKTTTTKDLKAELYDSYTIWATVVGKRPLVKTAYKLSDVAGNIIPIAEVLPNTESLTLIKTDKKLDIKRVYFLEIPEHGLKAFCSFDGWFRNMYSSKELGANIHENKTTIRVFAPRAERMKVYLYKGKHDVKAYREEKMIQDKDGVWEITFNENLNGVYYDFTVHGSGDPGNYFYETNPVHITDPYARVSDNTWGKARIWEKTSPASPLKNGIPKMQDVIAYEVHVQDFTDLLPVDENLKGTFTAMITPGLKNSKGRKIGFDYLVDLGINTIHLMPVQEYLHFPDDDWKASFKDDPYMIEQGISEENYQWGYRTSHCFAVESKYRTKDKEPGAERDEFRDLVQAFHDKNMAVIIDIVPNHTAENMDANEFYFGFNALDKMYYYRTKDFDHIGEYGNEVKTENRPMVQRWLIDQCRHWIDEFGIDGFRIDLAGQVDQQTLIALRAALGPEIIIYGEAWIGSNDPAFEANQDWDWYKEDSPITYFQDESRNAFKGGVFELNNKKTDRGWPGGKYSERENVKLGLINKCKDDKSPLSGITYLDIHDNFALADQFGTKDFDGRLSVDQDEYKIAVTLLYTSLGPIVTHGGSEIMRSKASAPLEEVVKETNAGFKTYMHGKRDTYNMRNANHFIWENVGAKPKGKNKNDYDNMHQFWKGLNAFRMSEYGNVFRVAEAVDDNYYQWITPDEKSQLGYIVDEKVFVLLNAGHAQAEFPNIKLPKGKWKMIANIEKVDVHKGIAENKYSSLAGEETISIKMEPVSLGIWVKE